MIGPSTELTTLELRLGLEDWETQDLFFSSVQGPGTEHNYYPGGGGGGGGVGDTKLWGFPQPCKN